MYVVLKNEDVEAVKEALHVIEAKKEKLWSKLKDRKNDYHDKYKSSSLFKRLFMKDPNKTEPTDFTHEDEAKEMFYYSSSMLWESAYDQDARILSSIIQMLETKGEAYVGEKAFKLVSDYLTKIA